MATGTNADLRKLWHPPDPYHWKTRRRRRGRIADLLLVDSDTVALVAEPAKNFLMIMNDGRIYKNSRRRV
jgi:hypothetical protein